MLLDKLKAGVSNIKQIEWPGTKDKVGLRVLTEAQIQQASFDTERLFKNAKLEFNTGIADAYQSEQNTQTLALALVKLPPNDHSLGSSDWCYPRLFESADALRPLLLPSVKESLIEELNAFQDECSPSLERLTKPEYEALFEDIKKNPSITNFLNSVTRTGLIEYLASLPPSSPPDSGPTSTAC